MIISTYKFVVQNDCDIMCSVSEPEKIVMTMESYITYGIKTLTSRPDYPAPEFNIRNDFNFNSL